jgi:1,4-alpha-glucan branching enzyme
MQVAFLVIAHTPHVRRSGRGYNGEEVVYDLIAQSLLPLTTLLSDLQQMGIGAQVALACSPLLSEQLADPSRQQRFLEWMEQLQERRHAELRRFEASHDHHGAYLSRFYIDWQHQALRTFIERYERNLLQKLRELIAADTIELLSSAASHAYLPLLSRAESVSAQIEQGILHTTRRLGKPEGFWLPGCGWRPGVERALGEVGIAYTIADPSSLPIGAVAQPHWLIQRRLAVCFIDDDLSRHIWSPEIGYMGDPLYRDPQDPSGYQAIGMREPQPYDPYFAFRRAQDHANHFVELLTTESKQRSADDLLVIPIDMQLLGKIWFEGVTWLRTVLTLCATSPAIGLTTPGAYLRRQRPTTSVSLNSGSWAAGVHTAWSGKDTATYWEAIHRAEAWMVEIATRYPSAEAQQERILNQAARELLLAQNSDWPALLNTTHNSVPERQRWRSYLDHFEQLALMIDRGTITANDYALLDHLEEQDNPFSALNYRVFARSG